MTQLDLVSWRHHAPRIEEPCRARKQRPTIEQRWAAWSTANAHVLAEMLRIARDRLAIGATFISTKALWEACRVSLGAAKDGGYKLNNDFTAPASRWLLEQEPRLVGVIKLRERRAK